MTDKAHHILTLVIQKEADIPRVRTKVKLLVRAIGAPVLQVTGVAVGASETARLILQQYGGGKVRISLFPVEVVPLECGIELLFRGNAPCLSGKACPLDEQALLGLDPFPGLITVFDVVKVQGGIRRRRITVHCRSTRLGVAWENVYGRLSGIRRELFADTEESYMENLRAKHDEVVSLLREKTEKNRLLDQSNNELLQLSNDLEELARERTIIEMSLRIADQVRNPATVIGGMARRLLNKGGIPKREQKRIKVIAAEADKIDEIVKQFNAMAEQRRILFGRENLVTLLGDALQACPTLQRKNITIKLDAPSDPVEIHANRHVLKIALIHVLRYLTRLLVEGEKLDIVIENSDEPLVSFSARSEGMQYRVGSEEPRSIAAVNETDQETSLELVRQILAEHQSSLQVENDGEGRAAITIRFPRVFREQGAVSVGNIEQE
ncbi:MAG: HAMP domain-containing histidine kinase [Deltaproteobacteria bacterium]|nr:HAMP domain-containing histidine kinase [Deltaproteobacteria bacterium]